MTLLDTSVVIDALRKPDPRLRRLFISCGAANCGVTRAEVLHGARTPADFQQLSAALAAFPQAPFPEPFWDVAGGHLRSLRAAGVVVPFADVLIATVALQNGIELWTRDNQFRLIQNVIPSLRLFQEPP